MIKATTTLALLGLLPAVHAAPGGVEPSGYFRTSLGAFEVVALADGVGSLPKALLAGDNGQIAALLEDDGIDGLAMPMPVNAFLVKTATKLILVDTGTGRNWGPPNLGHVIDNLRAAGYQPAQVDLILITHMHADHLGGLVSASGAALYPNAVVRMSQADSDFWLSEKNAAAAPPEARTLFDVARSSAAPYRRVGHWQPFDGAASLDVAVSAVPLPGHTPGHTAYRFTSNGRQLLVWGDVVHAVPVQMAHPEVTFGLDTAPADAAAARARLFTFLAAGKELVAGAHLPFPGIGRVRAAGAVYRWAPAPY